MCRSHSGRYKEGTSLRFSIDNLKLGAITAGDSYRISRMNAFFNLLGNELIFPTIVASYGNWHFEIDDAYHNKSAFTWHYALFGLSRITFGLCNALDTIQKTMAVILSLIEWQLAIEYLDDIIIFSCKQTKIYRLLNLYYRFYTNLASH